MNRRKFVTAALSAIPLMAMGKAKKIVEPKVLVKSIYSTEMHTKFFVEGIATPVKLLQLSDTHISLSSQADQKQYEYNNRMARAFVKVNHYQTKQLTTPFNCFKEQIKKAAEQKVDMIVLTGDIVNYPSPDDVAAILDVLKQSNIPFAYIAGNHDWHYEGMSGSANNLRKTWVESSLLPLYNGENPLYYSRMLGGINCVFIDNSTYQILPEQFEFMKTQLNGNLPVALFMHIPVYTPQLPMCCAHPNWNAANDGGYGIERRERWPVEGNSATTLNFAELLYNADNLLGLFVGHEHQYIQTNYKKLHQFLALPGYNGQYRMIEFLPATSS